MTLRRTTALIATAICLSMAPLNTMAQPAPKRPITPADLWAMKRVQQPDLSPDGRTAAVSVQEWNVGTNKSTSNIWLVPVTGGEARRLTSAQATDASPVWSPDGTRIAFVSKRGEDKANALYVIRTDGGEAEKLLELPFGISNPRWMPDGARLVVATTCIPRLVGTWADQDRSAMAKAIKQRTDSKMTAKATEDRVYRYWDHWITDTVANRMLLVNSTTKAITDLTPTWNRPFLHSGAVDFDLSPNGSHLALCINTTAPPYRQEPNADVYLIPTDGSGTMRNITAENRAEDAHPRFAPDGRSILFTRLTVPYTCGEVSTLWRHDLATGKSSSLTAEGELSMAHVESAADGSLWYTAEEIGKVPVFRMKADGTGRTVVYSQGTNSELRMRGGRIIFLNDDASHPGELFTLDPKSGTVRQLTHFNQAHLEQLDLGQVEAYWFDGAAGDKVQGLLFLPPGFDANKRYPLVQLMHGGPHTMAGDGWSYRWNAHVFAATGAVVTWVNRHGSTGFGQPFAQSILNEWGVKPLDDILRSTDHLLARFPNIDKDRVAAAGGSYGGYMAAWAAGHTDRFACLIDHAGVNDLNTQYGADLTNYSFTQVWGGTPWSNAEGMRKNDPMTYAQHFSTPMLILHGELDYRVPYVHGTALYGILQSMGVPSRLVIYPNENHWILSPQNAINWNWEVQRWLERYIGITPTLAEPRFEDEEHP